MLFNKTANNHVNIRCPVVVTDRFWFRPHQLTDLDIDIDIEVWKYALVQAVSNRCVNFLTDKHKGLIVPWLGSFGMTPFLKYCELVITACPEMYA